MRTSYIGVIITLAVLGGLACKSQPPADEQKKVDELQAQLDEAKKELAAKQEEQKAAEPAATPEPAAAPGPERSAAGGGAAKGAAFSPDRGRARADQASGLAGQQAAAEGSLPPANDREQRGTEAFEPVEYTIPAGTVIPVRATTELSTSRLATGSVFDAVLEKDLEVNGIVLAAQGAHVAGEVVSSDPGGRVKGVASLAVTIRSIAGLKDQTIRVKANRYSVAAPKSTGRDATRTGIMTGAGAVVGAIAGGKKGAAIGAGAGAATGVGATMATRGKAAVIPAETLMQFRLTTPSTVVYER